MEKTVIAISLCSSNKKNTIIINETLLKNFFPASFFLHWRPLVSSENLLRVHLMPSSKSLIKISDRTGPSTNITGCNSIYHHSLSTASQPVFYPVKSSLGHAIGCQLLQNVQETVTKVLLKSNEKTSTAFPSFPRWVSGHKRRSGWLSRTCFSQTPAGWAWSPGCPLCAAWWHSRWSVP